MVKTLRIAIYVRHFNSGSWQAATGTDYSILILVCDTPDLERRVQKTTTKSLGTLPYPFQVYTTNTESLIAASTAGDTVWTDVFNTKQPVSL